MNLMVCTECSDHTLSDLSEEKNCQEILTFTPGLVVGNGPPEVLGFEFATF